jgi:glutamyl-tRNA reductase
MFSDLFLIHRPGSRSEGVLNSVHTVGDVFFWKTCLRQIAIFQSHELAAQPTDEFSDVESGDAKIMRGEEAYRFLLQVICGLHSPLVGETEVYGQFKLTVASYKIPQTPWGSQLKRFFKLLFEDAKRIRLHHLEELGSQSYGSVLRRELKGARSIHVLGAGHLVQEILPWIAKDGNEVYIHCRQPEKALAELGVHPGVSFHAIQPGTLNELNHADALVVAAPVSAEWLDRWMPRSADSSLNVIVDFRADSAEDRISGYRVLDLSQVFGHIVENQSRIEARKTEALSAVDDAVKVRRLHVEYRPFGWEDVCA